MKNLLKKYFNKIKEIIDPFNADKHIPIIIILYGTIGLPIILIFICLGFIGYIIQWPFVWLTNYINK